MSLQEFKNILHKLEGDQQNKDLWNAIRSWCNELNYPEDYIISYIKQWQEELSDQTQEQLPFVNALFQQNEIIINIVEMKKMKINDVLLIAFVLTGVGVGLYLLDQKERNRRNRTPRREQNYNNPNHPAVPDRQLRQKNILILVIDAENNERRIDTLKREGKVTSEIWENIYNSMEALWMGEEREFNGTGLERIVSYNETSEPSEYDVYFVQIELQEYIQGFEKNRNYLERFDAFEALSKKEHEVIDISPRLSIQSTNHRILYR